MRCSKYPSGIGVHVGIVLLTTSLLTRHIVTVAAFCHIQSAWSVFILSFGINAMSAMLSFYLDSICSKHHPLHVNIRPPPLPRNNCPVGTPTAAAA